MKRIVFTCILFAAFTFGAEAQMSDVKLGAKAGINLSNFTASEYDATTGFHIGVLAEVFLSEEFSIQPEILYSTQGAEGKADYTDSDYTWEYNFDYINIPILAKYYFAEGFSVHAGPQLGFLTKAESKEDYNGEKETFDIKEYVNSFDFGINLGVGYELPMGVFFDVRYNLGLTKINKESDSEDDDLKNSVFQIGVGYKF